MKILLLGAGYVGSAVLRELQKTYQIIATTTTPEKVSLLQPLCPHVMLLNSSDSTALSNVLSECDAIAIFVAPKGRGTYIDTYVKTALEVEQALKGRQRPFYILYTSSTGVYENVKNQSAVESLSLQGDSANSKALLETEEIYKRCQNEFVKTCILRLGGIYGPGRTIEARAIRFSGKETPLNGEGITNHIHLDDIVNAVAFCFEKSLTGTYNLVNDDHPTRQELYDTLCRNLNLPLPIWKPDIPAASGRGYRVDNNKIKEVGFQFSRSLQVVDS